MFANTVMAQSGNLSSTATVIVTPGPLTTIIVVPTPVSMGIGTTQQFVAVGTDAAGNVVQFIPTWSVVAGGGAVNGTGVFTAGTVTGTFANTVQASNQGIKGTATVTVTPAPPATIVVTPNPVTLNVSLSQQFTAVARDASGNVVAITPVWTVVAGGGAISSAGLFTAGTTPGTFTNTVKATSGKCLGHRDGRRDDRTAGDDHGFTEPGPHDGRRNAAIHRGGHDAGGNVVAITPVWAVVAGVARSTSRQVSSPRAPRPVRIPIQCARVLEDWLACNGDRHRRTAVFITVTPNPVSVQTNGTQQFTAVGTDALGGVFAVAPVLVGREWRGHHQCEHRRLHRCAVSATFISTIKATVGALSGFATVTVTALPGARDDHRVT